MENSPVATLAQLLSFNMPTVVMVPMIATAEGLQPCFDFANFPLIAPFIDNLASLPPQEIIATEQSQTILHTPSPIFEPMSFSTPQTSTELPVEESNQLLFHPTYAMAPSWSLLGDLTAPLQEVDYDQHTEQISTDPFLDYIVPTEHHLSHEQIYTDQVYTEQVHQVQGPDLSLKAETPLIVEEERSSPIISAQESEQILQKAIIPTSATTSNPRTLKRPMNAYLLFCREWREALHRHDPFVNTRDLAAKLGRIWKALPHDVRQRYTSRSKEMKDDFYRQHPQLQRQKIDQNTSEDQHRVAHTHKSKISKRRK
eukprot:TRINITY_DN1082_c0_g1_i1.p1 TRINITY_DN1082_c0_g1~~TRINITY_DN1082_c0_g1_i1.p1  ORF type:complete len:313 (-),score=61.85 TRINITY_DN1082_c0_g1_i1:448-1386(-)